MAGGPGFARAYGRVVVSGYHLARTLPLGGAEVRPYVPGTSTPYPDPLYLDEAATVPATFPALTDATGALELWADAAGRVELECRAVGYATQRLVADLEPVPSAVTPITDVTITADASLTVAEAPPETFALSVRRSAESGNTLALRADGLFVPPPPERGTLTYRYASSTTMADPGAGFLRADGASGAGITELAFDVLTDGGTDASVLLRAVRAGDHLYVQDLDDSAHWVRFLASASASDQTGWFRLPVEYLDGSGSALGNNHRIAVTFTLSRPSTLADDYYTKVESDARFVDAAGDTVTGALGLPATSTVAGNLLTVSPDASNVLQWRPNGMWVPLPTQAYSHKYFYAANTTMADPGAGNFRTNTAVNPTQMAIDVRDGDNVDISDTLGGLKAGDTIRVQLQTDASVYKRARLTADPTNMGGWFSLSIVTVLEAGTAPASGACLVTFFLAGGGALPVDAYDKTEADARFVNATGDTITGALTVNAQLDAQRLRVFRPDGSLAHIDLYAINGAPRRLVASDQGSGQPRWVLNLGDSAVETGSNAGTDYSIERYADAGASLGAALTITRATGAATFGGALSTPGPVTVGGTVQPKITVAASAPGSPATGDLWIW